eukprot:CAMPEP_0115018294 /NCGR_PEP_ID=MMETSP0216-20121206/28708_1 /TAXON_ID=223996 /ORGANISM="Protocruzia adherens, Strain Boccale" /LENGTH=117 /DNA_ID=CAMNT_0002389437 /DNA_START=43 /DNA_END=393 /DNA_ORIENTATION=-
MSSQPLCISKLAQRLLRIQSNPAKARKMQRYMKTSQPFYGVYTPELKLIHQQLCQQFPATSNEVYRANTLELWEGTTREEQHLALKYAKQWSSFLTSTNIDLCERLIREGAWWDTVD